jgi:hypothetical protein
MHMSVFWFGRSFDLVLAVLGFVEGFHVNTSANSTKGCPTNEFAKTEHFL